MMKILLKKVAKRVLRGKSPINARKYKELVQKMDSGNYGFSQEEEKCKASRAVIESVDWDCEVLTNYSDKNLGCGRRIASGIEWVFSKVEEAIFLEDDCLPVYSFFKYCQELLEYYRHDERVMTINGTNLQSGQRRTKYSYHFTRYNCSWGWAS